MAGGEVTHCVRRGAGMCKENRRIGSGPARGDKVLKSQIDFRGILTWPSVAPSQSRRNFGW